MALEPLKDWAGIRQLIEARREHRARALSDAMLLGTGCASTQPHGDSTYHVLCVERTRGTNVPQRRTSDTNAS